MATHGVFIGINDYPGVESDLAGCVNDAHDWLGLFEPFCEKTQLLTNTMATKANMVSVMKQMLARAKAGDTVVITYSGHGSWVPDRDGDEPDGRDECLCPYDVRGGVILDDELRRLFLTRHPESKVLFITDSCHSGTVFQMLGERTSPIRTKFLPPSKFLLNGERTRARIMSAQSLAVRSDAPLPGVVHLAGCKDTEYSYDAVFKQRPNGALTYFAIKAYNALPKGATYAAWLAKILKNLPAHDYPQSPRLNADKFLLGSTVLGK